MSTPRIVAALLFVLLSANLISQEQLGMRLSNYDGVNSLMLNPAGNLSNPLNWDVNIAAAGFFFENNYTFLHRTGVLELLANRRDAEFLLANRAVGQERPNTFIVDFFDDKRRRFLNFSGFVEGPSFVVKIEDRHSFGLFTRFRSMGSAHRVPTAYSYYRYYQRPFFEQFSLHTFNGAVMGWSEIGLNYALKIPANSGALGFGINVRFLQGYEAAYLETRGTLLHTKLPGNIISLEQIDGRFGYTASNLEERDIKLQRNGRGFALDLGIVQFIGESNESYRLRLGASILDLGYLHFNRNAFNHNVRSGGPATLSLNDYERFDQTGELNDLIRAFSQDVLGDSLASANGDNFLLLMPSALNLQADYAFSKGFYLNTLLLQRFHLENKGLKRGNLLAVTPRFEHRWFSASLPVSLYNWQDLRVGLAARLGFLVLGTDNLMSWVGQRKFTGTDFYLALKLNPFNLRPGSDDGNDNRQHRKKGKVKCYDF